MSVGAHFGSALAIIIWMAGAIHVLVAIIDCQQHFVHNQDPLAWLRNKLSFLTVSSSGDHTNSMIAAALLMQPC